jgi:hypothetical protein
MMHPVGEKASTLSTPASYSVSTTQYRLVSIFNALEEKPDERREEEKSTERRSLSSHELFLKNQL